MTGHDIILGQLDRLWREVGRARTAIERSEVDAYRTRVVPTLQTSLESLNARVQLLLDRVAPDTLEADWRELTALECAATVVFDECLAMMQGAWARKAGLDAGLGVVTDALLDDLSYLSNVPWNRFTLLGTSEFYRPTAAIIRIRFPELSLWSVPLAAHEFGHYVGIELSRSVDGEREYPFQDRLKLADQTKQGEAHTREWFHLQELFADTFATYAIGPAYVAAFIMLRLNPTRAALRQDTHPAAVVRVYAMLWLLDHLDTLSATPVGRFQGTTTYLRESWEGSLLATSQNAKLTAAEASLVAQRAEELLKLIQDVTPSSLRFGPLDWLRAQQIANLPRDGVVPAEATRRDVLNAAWVSRLQCAAHAPRAFDDIARDVERLYKQIHSSRNNVQV